MKVAAFAEAAYLEQKYAEEIQRTDEFARAAFACHANEVSFPENESCRSAWELNGSSDAIGEGDLVDILRARILLSSSYTSWLEREAGVSATDPSFWRERTFGIEAPDS